VLSKILKKLKRAKEIFGKSGFVGVQNHARFLLHNRNRKKNYQAFVLQSKLTEFDREKIRQAIVEFARKPLISIVMPVYNVDEKWLRLCIESVCGQIYRNWEFCIADDCSPSLHIRKVLAEYQAKDSRFKIVFRPQNGHISAASNSALELATGEFCVLLDHDDELSEDALFYVAKELNDFPQTSMIYSDEDLIDQKGNHFEPKFKPDWSLDLFYSLNLITHLSAYRTEVLRKIGGFKIGIEGSQDYDLAFRVIEQISENEIRHIPKILYHWRAIPGSVALDAGEKSYAHERARTAIRNHFERTNIKAKVTNGWKTLHRVIYDLPENTTFEVISSRNSTAGVLNNLANKANSDVLIFVEPGIDVVDKEAFTELTRFAMQDKTGAVGGKILNKNGSVRSCGILFGVNGFIGFANRGLPNDYSGVFARASVVNNFSAVSGVLAVRRELFQQTGGFDAEHFENGLFDLDLCLRLRAENYRIIFTPYAEFIQTSVTATENIIHAKNSKEVSYFKQKYARTIQRDPFFNPNLDTECFEIKL
jgi:O-antigen biosynthesis protein